LSEEIHPSGLVPGLLERPARRAVLTAVRQSLISEITVALGVAAGYFAMCWLGLSFDVTAGVSSVWPASGFLAGLLLIVPRDRWRAMVGGALLAALPLISRSDSTRW
jgi:integral membrane sensor domain MASE1